MSQRVVVVGSSVGGVRTAQALRTAGYRGGIALVGEESCLPYDKPPLSKGVLTGTRRAQDACLLTAQAAATEDIELVLGRRATRLDQLGRHVELDDGTRLDYDAVVIATGARARPAPWTCSGVHVLRTMRDVVALRDDLLGGGPVVVVGGGFIGAEVASAARGMGLEVTMVDPVPVPMSRVLSPEIGEHVLDLHRRHGVRTRLGTGVCDIEGEQGALRVLLTDGTTLEAGTVVVGIGSCPNDEWLRSSALLVDDGVVCDEFGRAEGADRVYAVGDVARWYDPAEGGHTRIEHWTNAVEQARVVAHNITAPADLRAHRPVHFVWSDQHDWKIQVVGRPAVATAVVVVGDPLVDGRFAALYTRDRIRLSAAVSVNWPRAGVLCRRALPAAGRFDDVRAQLEAALTGGRDGREPR